MPLYDAIFDDCLFIGLDSEGIAASVGMNIAVEVDANQSKFVGRLNDQFFTLNGASDISGGKAKWGLVCIRRQILGKH